jgi:hypothetical protein
MNFATPTPAAGSQMSGWQDYSKQLTSQTRQNRLTGAVAGGLKGIGEGISQRADASNQQLIQNLSNRPSQWEDYFRSLMMGAV